MASTDAQVIHAMYHSMYRFMIECDVARLAALHDDSFVLVHMTGRRQGKRASARKAGHAGPWAQLEAAKAGDMSHVWENVPAEVPACGAFPIRVGDEWVATIAVSGYMEGLDYEIILRALEQALGVTVSRWSAAVM